MGEGRGGEGEGGEGNINSAVCMHSANVSTR